MPSIESSLCCCCSQKKKRADWLTGQPEWWIPFNQHHPINLLSQHQFRGVMLLRWENIRCSGFPPAFYRVEPLLLLLKKKIWADWLTGLPQWWIPFNQHPPINYSIPLILKKITQYAVRRESNHRGKVMANNTCLPSICHHTLMAKWWQTRLMSTWCQTTSDCHQFATKDWWQNDGIYSFFAITLPPIGEGKQMAKAPFLPSVCHWF